MKRVAMVLVAAALMAPHSAIGSDVFAQLVKARCLRCEFGVGVQTSWKSGQAKSTQTNFGKEGILTFDSIDAKAGKARMIAGGAADVRVIPTLAGLTFVEETGAGNLIFTTVFAQYDTPESRRFVAVMSRHIDMNGPFPSQYHGTCTILE